jgi:hypothetical protein
MNETVMPRHADMQVTEDRRSVFLRLNRSGSYYGYLALTFFVALGWLLRDKNLINPEEGVGYWLGIVGGSIMLFLLAYPLRKRYRFLSIFGSTRHWFRLHMIFGLVGPLFILYHCNFNLGSFNSQVALYCMLLVAGSGIVGRHFYTRIHNGLFGRKLSLQEIQKELTESREKGRGLAKLAPEVVKKLNALADELKGCEITQSLSIRQSLKWSFASQFIRFRLRWTAHRELKAAAARSDMVRRDQARLRKIVNRYIRYYTALVCRVAQFSFYEKLFALWHVFHLPFFAMLVISALVHVLAVHMY